MNIEFMCGLLANYSKELSEAETYREKGDVQLKHAKLMLDKVKNCSIPAVSGSSLPLKIESVIVVAAQRWGKDYAGSTVGIIGRDAIEICEKYGIDWENYR